MYVPVLCYYLIFVTHQPCYVYSIFRIFGFVNDKIRIFGKGLIFMLDVITERILDLVQKSGETDKNILENSKISKSSLTEWRKGKAKPSTDAIIKLAQYFHVSTDYLLLGKVSEQSIIPALSKDDLELLELYHQLSELDQGQCLGFIKGLIIKESAETTSEKKASGK